MSRFNWAADVSTHVCSVCTVFYTGQTVYEGQPDETLRRVHENVQEHVDGNSLLQQQPEQNPKVVKTKSKSKCRLESFPLIITHVCDHTCCGKHERANESVYPKEGPSFTAVGSLRASLRKPSNLD